ncbi:MAG: hypothetical protein IT384_18750 [Deltaproteobacteria bacterium]|nr:hypothetical protein [Deltaproteobacteria bacterium]
MIRARLGAGARDQLTALEARNLHGVYVDRTPDGRVGVLAGDELQSESCATDLAAARYVPYSPIWHEESARCFIVSNASLLLGEDAPFDPSTLVLEGAWEGQFSGEHRAALYQRHGGVRIVPGDVKLYYAEGRLMSFHGEVHDIRQLPSRPAFDAGARLVSLGVEEQGEVFDRGAYFDIGRNAFLHRIDVTSGPNAGSTVVVDEASGEVVDRISPVDSVEVVAGLHAFNYPLGASVDPPLCEDESTGTTLWPALPPTPIVPEPIKCSAYPGGICLGTSGSCLYSLVKQEPYGSDYPIAYNNENGPGGGLGTLVQRTQACGGNPVSPSPWANIETPIYEFYATAAYAAVKYLADIKQHWSSYYPAHTGTPLPVVVQRAAIPGNSGTEGAYNYANTRLHLREDRDSNPQFFGAENLHTIAHEYGHYIHHRLAGLSYGDVPGPVKEGWADTVPLRYLVYRSVFDGYWGLSYFSAVGPKFYAARHFSHTQWNMKGELQPGGRDTRVGSNAALFYSPAGPFCSGATPHECGAVLSLIYWELALDFCHTSFLSCSEGQRIVQQGSYLGWGWALANSAFAYAVSMSTASTDVYAFMANVAARYDYFRSLGYLDQASYNRVVSVPGHHCTFPATLCSSGHKFPGSMLPSAYTSKWNWSEGEQYRVEYFPVSDSFASGGQALWMWPSTSAQAGFYAFTVSGPSDNWRRVHVVAKATGPVTIEYALNAGPWLTAQGSLALGSAGYKRLDAGIDLQNLATGNHSIRLRQKSGPNMMLDAVFISPAGVEAPPCDPSWPVSY